MNYIFDVDGTLLDSYGGILESVMEVIKINNYDMNSNDALDFILKYAVFDLFYKMEHEANIPFDKMVEEYKKSRLRTQDNYVLMPNCLEMLKQLNKNGAKLFIFTHKGEAINHIVEKNFKGIFIDVIHAFGHDFKRKPDSYSIDYLVGKYNLDRNETFYVGDRPIDIDCAYNANIKSIFYNEKNVALKHEPDYRIKDLLEIIEIDKK
ncbi:MAG: HAD family hydrolase [Acholeplasmatales bacterium]|nr:HAD family hydrolase [Acholeplasmatales bacterium]